MNGHFQLIAANAPISGLNIPTPLLDDVDLDIENFQRHVGTRESLTSAMGSRLCVYFRQPELWLASTGLIRCEP